MNPEMKLCYLLSIDESSEPEERPVTEPVAHHVTCQTGSEALSLASLKAPVLMK